MARDIKAVIQIGADEWLVCRQPVRVVQAEAPGEVREALEEVERLTRDFGWHAVGFLAYEAGTAFGLAARSNNRRLPLLWFAFFEPDHVRRAPTAMDHIDHHPLGGYVLGPLVPALDRDTYRLAFDRIRAHLADGNTYQVNFTFPLTSSFSGDSRSLFLDLIAAQRGAHSAFLCTGSHSICSASPELFFALEGLTITARPMKGTAPRGRTLAEDRRSRDDLASSAKERAENVMVTDMVRNDLGRIAIIGSVNVAELFHVERYPNVWQMTSTITARSAVSLADLVAALHPSASVTGAPKARTMEIIAALEQRPRGVYTGAIGHVWPNGNASFNVAIRTAVIDHEAGRLEFGVGSGVVWDSHTETEYAECLVKGSVVGARPEPFKLLETLRWTSAEGFFLLERHLSRLAASAEYFDYALDLEAARRALHEVAAGARESLRVRLLVDARGHIETEQTPLLRNDNPLRVTLAREPVDSTDVFLFHKTTRRAVYENARRPGFDDVLLWNTARELTEATTANLVVEIDGRLVTPPVECGLLAGTYREALLAAGAIEERVVQVDDLTRATGLWLINAVHETRVAVLVS